MSDVKHTAGPWIVNDTTVMDATGISVCDVDGELSFDADKANAQLIAAAPEMLEALKAIETLTDIDETHTDLLVNDIAEAVIAKATGATA